MSVLQEHLINNDPSPRLRTKDGQIRVVEQIPAESSSRPRETRLSFVDDFTREHSRFGLRIKFTEIPGIF